MSAPFASSRDPEFPQRSYEAGLARLFIPDAVIQTKIDHRAPTWMSDTGRSLRHNAWRVCTSDLDQVRRRENPEIRLDANVGYRLSLAHPSLASDNLTKKTIVVRLLTTGLAKGPVTSLTAYRAALCFDWFLRWRVAHGIACNAHLGLSHFRRFIADLAAGDVLSLVPMADRLEQFAGDLETGTVEFPTILTGSFAGALDWLGLAELLGVTRNSLSSSRKTRRHLRDIIARVDPPGRKKLLDSLDTSMTLPKDGEPSSRKYEDYLEVWATFTSSRRADGFRTTSSASTPSRRRRRPSSRARSAGRRSEPERSRLRISETFSPPRRSGSSRTRITS